MTTHPGARPLPSHVKARESVNYTTNKGTTGQIRHRTPHFASEMQSFIVSKHQKLSLESY